MKTKKIRLTEKKYVTNTFEIHGSNGHFTVTQSGEIIICHSTEQEYLDINKFDVSEYKSHYDITEINGSVDILDFAYFLKNGEYEEVCTDWREEVALLRKGIDVDIIFHK
jgi:hypothetical protein